MGISKNKKQKRKDVQKPKKVENIQKSDKEKKLHNENKLNGSDTEDTLTNLFKIDELQELRKILKTSTLATMPLILGAVILKKFDVVKKLIKQGYDVNAVGCDKTTSLMWAVKTKNLEMIDLLVSRGADVTSFDESGENTIFMALNSPEWDENCFLDFWQSVRKMNEINLEFANKTGNRILHFAVKRQWSLLIESLIENNVNINSCNNKGVSAITMAAARNDLKLVNLLLNAKANVFQEDVKGNTPICYTIVNIIRKNLSPPYEIFEQLTKGFSRANYERYIEGRFALLISPPNNDLNSYIPNVNKITTAIISFVMKHLQNGVDILLKIQMFNKIRKAIEKHQAHFEYIQCLLSILATLLRWCDCCTGVKTNTHEHEVGDKFIHSGAIDSCLLILKYYSSSNSVKQLLPNIFLPLFLACGTQTPVSRKWLKNNLEKIEPYYNDFLDICFINFNIKEDEYHLQLVKNKIRLFKEMFDELKTELLQLREIVHETVKDEFAEDSKIQVEEKTEEIQHGRKHAKRMRRKARALKARIDRIRSADVVERIRITKNKNVTNTNSGIIEIKEENCAVEAKDENKSNKEIIEIKLSHTVDSSSSESVEAQAIALNVKETLPNTFVKTSFSNNSELLAGIMNVIGDKEYENRKTEFGAALMRLKVMLNDIICKYKFLWALDAHLGHPQFRGGQGDNIHPLLQGTREEQLEKLKPLLPFIEQQYLAKLVDNFNKTIEKIKNLFLENNETYKTLVKQLHHILSEHEIRGEKCLKIDFDKEEDEFYDEEVIPGKYGAIGDHLQRTKILKNEFNKEEDETFNEEIIPGKYGAIGDHLHKEHNPTYMELIENILPEKFQQSKKQLSENDIFYSNEMSAIPPFTSSLTKEEAEKIKQNTEDNAYHLVKTAYNVCESDSMFGDWDEEFISPYMRRMMQKAKEKKERSFPIQRININTYKAERSTQDLIQYPEKSRPNNSLEPEPTYQSQEIQKVSRWETTIRSLQTILKQQFISKGGGDDAAVLTFTCPKELSGKFTIANGGNFGGVELGFDRNGRPLAVKRINSVAFRQLYGYVRSVMGIRHTNLLNYSSCDLDPASPTDLLLSTPLCEYNLGEYVMCLKLQQPPPRIAAGLVIQLLHGLQHLHRSRPEPIVHGNLKPSNVLIDIRGRLRLAEFGIYQTLYLRDRAPKSSIIWFARETYEAYEHNRGGMHCTSASDIQVAGMLLHFTLTWGLHPFGVIAEDILRNLVQGHPNLQTTTTDADDLISWMLVYEWCERPSVAQVLNHIFFWPPLIKWRFLLTCSGLTEEGAPLPDLPLQRFHSFLEIFSKRQGIAGDWVSIVRERFPNIDLTFFEPNEDTPTGVLKFLRPLEMQMKKASAKGRKLKNL